MPYHLAILTGGTGAERGIAIQSAESIAAAIGSRATMEVFDFPKDLDPFLVSRKSFDCVIPVFHGRGGEDGTIQGFLETLGLPYIFSGVEAQALAIDKAKTNTLIRAVGIGVPPHQILTANEKFQWTKTVVIKPVDGGSSVGVAIAHNQEELERGIQTATKNGAAAMIEEYIPGQEYSVAVIDANGQPVALPVISIAPKHAFFDYASKYEVGLADEKCPADIPESLSGQLHQAALKVHSSIGARHVSRSDFIVDAQEKIWFLEMNTIPGMSVLLPKAIAASRRDFGEVLMGWVNQAMLREKTTG